jgi:hypothetical protein
LGGGEEAGIGSGRGGWARARERERDRGGLEEVARVRVGEAPPWRSADWEGMGGRDWGEEMVLFPDLGFHRRAKGRARKRAGRESLSVGSTRVWPHLSSAQTEKIQVTKKLTDRTAQVKSRIEKITVSLIERTSCTGRTQIA